MPPLPDDISVALYENHPTNKAVYDLTPQGQALDDAVLTPDVADNGLFELRDGGQIWWQASPDFETRQDADDDGVYIIRITHDNNGRGYTEVEVSVADLAIELTPERWLAYTTEVEGFGFTYEQVKDILPDNEFVQYILRGFAFAVPSEGPVIITWSLVTPDSDLSSYLRPPDTDTQEEIDEQRANLNRAFAEFEAATNLQFIEVADSAEKVGHIRVYLENLTLVSAGSTGDSLTTSINLRPEDMRYSTYVHEIGHALGLAHPFTIDGHGGFNLVDDRYLRSDRSIMSYHGWQNEGLQQTDIEALQFLYGDENDPEINGLQAALADIQ